MPSNENQGMTISYNWLLEYLPQPIEPQVLSEILTSIGLEVESMEPTSSVRGGLHGLVVGEVLTCTKHPEADRLSLTTVNIGTADALNIVCGAPNVAAGQKVIVAPVGCTIHPQTGNPFTIQKAKIRGAVSEGMLCAEDEIGLGDSHDGIMVLPAETPIGTSLRTLFPVDEDVIYEIGLTPNRMDAMSHLGVARDVCAYLSYHRQQKHVVRSPLNESIVLPEAQSKQIKLQVESELACPRYAGICLTDVSVKESPDWLKNRLQSIGLKPVNNIVDITNFILHETGQPLHAFDLDKIEGNEIRVGYADAGSHFVMLDGKQIELKGTELMIKDASKPLCIAGVYGGQNSGVSASTKNIFLESACFEKQSIRKTSMLHGLRTDAAIRFEKGVDISNTVTVLSRAVQLILDIAGGSCSSSMIEYYPNPSARKQMEFNLTQVQKLSGKTYDASEVRSILEALGFEWLEASGNNIKISVPHHKSDIHLTADIVEEVMRIDGLDRIEIAPSFQMSPSGAHSNPGNQLKARWTDYLVNAGYHEIFTNSISNQQLYSEETLKHAVKMMNSLTVELNIMRPEMLPSGLQVIQHNLNHRNRSLRMFEFGKTYRVEEGGQYTEKNHLVIYMTGDHPETGWQQPAKPMNFFDIKGIVDMLFRLSGLTNLKSEAIKQMPFLQGIQYLLNKKLVCQFGLVETKGFDIKQPVYFASLDWDQLSGIQQSSISYREWSKFPAVQRDLALVVEKKVSFSQLEAIALTLGIGQLKKVQLFDVFMGEKLGADKKSMALSFTFVDEQKTMTDTDIDGFMQKIIGRYEKELMAEIRK